MFGSALLLAVSALAATFLTNRIVVGLHQGELNVRGWLYTRKSTPFLFWATMFFATMGLLFTLAIAVLLAWGFWIGFIPR